jgi:hypothetical protein
MKNELTHNPFNNDYMNTDTVRSTIQELREKLKSSTNILIVGEEQGQKTVGVLAMIAAEIKENPKFIAVYHLIRKLIEQDGVIKKFKLAGLPDNKIHVIDSKSTNFPKMRKQLEAGGVFVLIVDPLRLKSAALHRFHEELFRLSQTGYTRLRVFDDLDDHLTDKDYSRMTEEEINTYVQKVKPERDMRLDFYKQNYDKFIHVTATPESYVSIDDIFDDAMRIEPPSGYIKHSEPIYMDTSWIDYKSTGEGEFPNLWRDAGFREWMLEKRNPVEDQCLISLPHNHYTISCYETAVGTAMGMLNDGVIAQVEANSKNGKSVGFGIVVSMTYDPILRTVADKPQSSNTLPFHILDMGELKAGKIVFDQPSEITSAEEFYQYLADRYDVYVVFDLTILSKRAQTNVNSDGDRPITMIGSNQKGNGVLDRQCKGRIKGTFPRCGWTKRYVLCQYDDWIEFQKHTSNGDTFKTELMRIIKDLKDEKIDKNSYIGRMYKLKKYQEEIAKIHYPKTTKPTQKASTIRTVYINKDESYVDKGSFDDLNRRQPDLMRAAVPTMEYFTIPWTDGSLPNRFTWDFFRSTIMEDEHGWHHWNEENIHHRSWLRNKSNYGKQMLCMNVTNPEYYRFLWQDYSDPKKSTEAFRELYVVHNEDTGTLQIMYRLFGQEQYVLFCNSPYTTRYLDGEYILYHRGQDSSRLKLRGEQLLNEKEIAA